MRAQWWSRSHFVDAVLRVVLEEGAGRRVIFSTFDPDCATLLSLKQPRFPVFFLTCGGTKAFTVGGRVGGDGGGTGWRRQAAVCGRQSLCEGWCLPLCAARPALPTTPTQPALHTHPAPYTHAP